MAVIVRAVCCAGVMVTLLSYRIHDDSLVELFSISIQDPMRNEGLGTCTSCAYSATWNSLTGVNSYSNVRGFVCMQAIAKTDYRPTASKNCCIHA